MFNKKNGTQKYIPQPLMSWWWEIIIKLFHTLFPHIIPPIDLSHWHPKPREIIIFTRYLSPFPRSSCFYRHFSLSHQCQVTIEELCIAADNTRSLTYSSLSPSLIHSVSVYPFPSSSRYSSLVYSVKAPQKWNTARNMIGLSGTRSRETTCDWGSVISPVDEIRE